MGACTHIKENILCVWGKKNKEMKDERHPDRDSYLKEHFGWNRNLEQSQLKCELSSGEGIKGEREKEMEGKNDIEKKTKQKSKSPKSSLLVVRALLMEEEQKRTKWTTATIFNYVLKLDLLPKCGLLTVSNKQLVIASMSSVRWSRMRRRDSGCKQNKTKKLFCLCPLNK